MDTYTTIQGDTWDMIAHKCYGDAKKAHHLMQARQNIRLLDYQVFPTGITVVVPVLQDDDYEDDVPDWRKD